MRGAPCGFRVPRGDRRPATARRRSLRRALAPRLEADDWRLRRAVLRRQDRAPPGRAGVALPEPERALELDPSDVHGGRALDRLVLALEVLRPVHEEEVADRAGGLPELAEDDRTAEEPLDALRVGHEERGRDPGDRDLEQVRDE